MAKKDLLLNPCGDLMIRDGDFVIVQDADQVRQSWLIRVRTFQGEWLLDAKMGLPYFQVIFEKGTSRRHIEQMFVDMTLATPGVIRVISSKLESLDPARRSFELAVEAIVEGPEHATFRYDSTLAPSACSPQGNQEYPTTIPGLAVWLDAQDLSNLTWDGTHLIMQNKAGTGRAVGAGLSGEPQLVGSSIINGHRAVKFINTITGDENTFQQRLDFDDTPALNSGERTLIAVFRRVEDTVESSAAVLSLKGISLDTLPTGIEVLNSFQDSESTAEVRTFEALVETLDSTSGVGSLNYEPEIIVVRCSSDVEISRNGAALTVLGDYTDRLLDGSGHVGCGEVDGQEALFFHGTVGEVIAYNRKLSDNETTALTLWLRNKWGVSALSVSGWGHGPWGHFPWGHGVQP